MTITNLPEELLEVLNGVRAGARGAGFQNADADDLGSAAVERLLSVRERIDGRGMIGLGRRIGQNLGKDLRRMAARRGPVGLHQNEDGTLAREPVATTPDPATAAASAEIIERIHSFLETRSETVQAILRLRVEEGLTLAETARRMNLSLGKLILILYRLRDEVESICLGE